MKGNPVFRVDEAGQFRSTVTFVDLRANLGAIEDKHVKAAAGLQASKLQHQHRRTYAQESATAPATGAWVVHTVVGTVGKLLGFRVGCVVAPSTAETVVVDLLVNGASVLTAQVTIDDGDAAYALVEGVISSDALAAGDVVEVKVVSSTGSTQKGVFAEVDLEENYT